MGKNGGLASKVTKLEAASTGCKPFAFNTSLYEFKTAKAFTLDKQIVRRLVRPADLTVVYLKTAIRLLAT